MAQERTLSIVKPDAVASGAAGAILHRIQDAGLEIVALKMLHLTEATPRSSTWLSVWWQAPCCQRCTSFR